MSLYPLKDRLSTLPLILAGPILRQVSPESVTVWVALRAKARVSLVVKPSTGNDVWGTPIAETPAPVETVALGPNLHVLAITAPTKESMRLSPGHLYGYNLTFSDVVGAPSGDLFAANVFAKDEATAKKWLTYSQEGFSGGAPSMPSFVFRPEHPKDLRIAQGSCRKAHGESMDALSLLDSMIKQTFQVGATEPRPHLLMLGGDQIYADDVADQLLKLLIDAGEVLLGKEVFPAPPDNLPAPTELDYRPGYRWDICNRIHLTAGADGDNGTSKSHLLKLSDWYTMYLFAWSDVLWPPLDEKGIVDLPYIHEVHPSPPPAERVKRWTQDGNQFAHRFVDENERLELFHKTLRNVRRALANVPTYMIFDDHEVTDDWLLNREWCTGLLSPKNPMGRQVMQNGLLAYTLFQGWGNTPEQFGPDTLGARLLTEATMFWNDGSPSQKQKSAQIQLLLGIPVFEADGKITRPAESIKFHYQVTTPGWELIVLNTRTRRRYPGELPRELPDMMDDVAFKQMIPDTKVPSSDYLTMVVAPTNVISEYLTEYFVQLLSDDGKKPFGTDAGDAWAGQREGFERLLGSLADRAANDPSGRRKARVVVLSGDIHYSFAFHMQYWADRPYRAAEGAQPVEMVMAELTASSFKNEALKTRGLDWGKSFTLLRTPWWGWPTPLGGADYTVRMTKPARSDFERPVNMDAKLLEQTPALMGNEHIPKLTAVHRKPDWRYLIDMVPATYAPMGSPVQIVEKPTVMTPRWWLERSREVLSFLRGRSTFEVLRGRMVVGHNNLGDVRFQWGAGEEKAAALRLWWRTSDDETPTAWRSNFTVPLRFDQKDIFKRPTLPGEE